MSVFHHQTVTCRCGATFTANVVRSLNVRSIPAARNDILTGTFHAFDCVECDALIRVEKAFAYIDFERNTIISVWPREIRHLWKEAESEMTKNISGALRNAHASNENQTRRVVFGLSELREKLVLEDAGLDDCQIELLKVLLIYEHPFLVQQPRMNLTVDQVTEDNIEFLAYFDHSKQHFRILFPREIVDPILANGTLLAWQSNCYRRPPFSASDGDDLWINIWRLSPQTWALRYLSFFARKAENGENIDTGSREFNIMISYLPRGNHLPRWAKRDLRKVHEVISQAGKEQVELILFQIRFDKGLEDDWAYNNDPNDIDTLWDLLKNLPDSNVEGSTTIREILLDQGKGGGWYNPKTFEIGIGSRVLSNREKFEDVVRHEVGHSVHFGNKKIVDKWLLERFGFQQFPKTNHGINLWVEHMGGWGEILETERLEVYEYLRSVLGTTNWKSGTLPDVPAKHAWFGRDFGPRLAYEQSQAKNRWWENNQNWFKACNKAFFLNYYYKKFMVVNEKTLSIIADMPSSYAAMSPLEFFAELYAVFHDIDDKEHRKLPDDVKRWLTKYVGAAGSESK